MITDTSPPSDKADKYILRFERPGHRDELKAKAAEAKRSLNKHILHLIEEGEKAGKPPQGTA
jgi:hypothetical protein